MRLRIFIISHFSVRFHKPPQTQRYRGVASTRPLTVSNEWAHHEPIEIGDNSFTFTERIVWGIIGVDTGAHKNNAINKIHAINKISFWVFTYKLSYEIWKWIWSDNVGKCVCEPRLSRQTDVSQSKWYFPVYVIIWNTWHNQIYDSLHSTQTMLYNTSSYFDEKKNVVYLKIVRGTRGGQNQGGFRL